MGVLYYLVSHKDRVGYELGKGAWGEPEFPRLLRGGSVESLAKWILDEHSGFTRDGYVQEIAREMIAFVGEHPEWAVIDDCCDDITVSDKEDWQRLVIEEKQDPYDRWFPIYRLVGTRHRPAR